MKYFSGLIGPILAALCFSGPSQSKGSKGPEGIKAVRTTHDLSTVTSQGRLICREVFGSGQQGAKTSGKNNVYFDTKTEMGSDLKKKRDLVRTV